MVKPVAVVISACAIPPVTAFGSSIPACPRKSKEAIIPVTVPRIPSRGAKVIIVSRIAIPLFILSISSSAAISRINMLEMAADDEIDRMKRGMAILDTIITFAPLLGILGTVTGIIASFDFLGQAGIEDPKAVTGGIAQALITTATGLTIALATIIPYNYFVVKLEKAARNIEKCTTSFEIFHKRVKDEDKS